MGIWIRSQDGKSLTEVRKISFEELYRHKDTGEYYNEIYSSREKFKKVCNLNGLGIYSSKEKAIKVLNMIQEHIENQNNYFENLNAGTEYGGLIVTQKSKVFSMPLDEEVTV